MTMIRTRQALISDYTARGIDCIVGRPLGELQELKSILAQHPAYSDPKHELHATVAADMSQVYRALDVATNPDTDIEQE